MRRNKLKFQRRKNSKNDQIVCENRKILLLLWRFEKFYCYYLVYSGKMSRKVRIVEVSPEPFSAKGHNGIINALSVHVRCTLTLQLAPPAFHRSGVPVYG